MLLTTEVNSRRIAKDRATKINQPEIRQQFFLKFKAANWQAARMEKSREYDANSSL
jgi:hypothetical protein